MNYKYYEQAAIKVYQNLGYRLIVKNYRKKGYEIDLLLQKRDKIQIVEVKATCLDSIEIINKFTKKQYRFYKRFLSKIENSRLSSYNLSFEIIIFAKNTQKTLEFERYKIF